MSLQVCLPSGKSCPVSIEPGSQASVVRQDLGRTLEVNPASIELIAGDKILEDHDTVPDDTIHVVLSPHPWLDDGSGHVKDLGGCAFEIVGDPSRGSPINALCDVGLSNAEAYFEVEVISGDGAWIGVGTKQGFAQGWRCKGLFFGGPGNLSNGSGGLKIGFGEEVKAGSIVGISLDLSDPCSVGLKVTQNGKLLGLAFEKCPRARNADVFPVVRAKKTGDSFRIAFRQKERLNQQCEPPHPAVGTWRLVKLVDGGHEENLSLYTEERPALKVEEYMHANQSFRLSFKVGNTLSTIATVARDAEVEKLKLVNVGSTLMGVTGALGALEDQISRALSRIKSWDAIQRGDDPMAKELRIDGTNLEMLFTVDNCTDPPVTDDILIK